LLRGVQEVLGHIRGYEGGLREYIVSDTAQVSALGVIRDAF